MELMSDLDIEWLFIIVIDLNGISDSDSHFLLLVVIIHTCRASY